MPKSVLGWAALLIIGIWVVSNPVQAGAAVHHVFSSVVAFASSL